MKREDQQLLKDYQADLKLMEKECNNLYKRMHEVKNKIAQLTSEFKTGDTVLWKHGRGERKGVIMEVMMGGLNQVAYSVKPIMKDGSLGKPMRLETWCRKVWGTKA